MLALLVLAGAAVGLIIRPHLTRGGRNLDPTGLPVRLNGIVVSSPRLEGKARLHKKGSHILQGDTLLSSQLREALDREGFAIQETIDIREAREKVEGMAGELHTKEGLPGFSVQLPPPGPGHGQVLLSANESGVLHWHYPGEMGTADRYTYFLRRHVPPAVKAALRGLIPAASKKIVHVLTYKLVDAAAGPIGKHFALRWEERNRPYGLRFLTPEDRRKPAGQDVTAYGWDRLASGPSLLFIHGTFSRAHSAFAGLSDEIFQEMHRRYEGRVVAFDHHTLSHDPKQNIEWLIRQLPKRIELTLDIICHSRGGLVSRVLAEKQGELPLVGQQIRVRRVIFVASPNAGTVLTDGSYISHFIDSYTNLLNWFPQSDTIDMLQGILASVKQISIGVLDGLDGLASMRPRGPFLKWLNEGPKGASEYYALASNFDCLRSGVTDRIYDRMMDEIFGAENDLVVPTEGVYDTNGSDCFPIVERKVFGPRQGVSHGGFFSHGAAQEALLRWLETKSEASRVERSRSTEEMSF